MQTSDFYKSNSKRKINSELDKLFKILYARYNLKPFEIENYPKKLTSKKSYKEERNFILDLNYYITVNNLDITKEDFNKVISKWLSENKITSTDDDTIENLKVISLSLIGSFIYYEEISKEGMNGLNYQDKLNIFKYRRKIQKLVKENKLSKNCNMHEKEKLEATLKYITLSYESRKRVVNNKNNIGISPVVKKRMKNWVSISSNLLRVSQMEMNRLLTELFTLFELRLSGDYSSDFVNKYRNNYRTEDNKLGEIIAIELLKSEKFN